MIYQIANGPYTNHEGRKIVFVWDRGKRVCILYAKYLLCNKIGRKLFPNEEVDHIDNDKTNDDINNLQVITYAENRRKSIKPAERYYFTCPICNRFTWIPMRYYKHNQINNKKAGPFCDRYCAGKANKIKQMQN